MNHDFNSVAEVKENGFFYLALSKFIFSSTLVKDGKEDEKMFIAYSDDENKRYDLVGYDMAQKFPESFIVVGPTGNAEPTHDPKEAFDLTSNAELVVILGRNDGKVIVKGVLERSDFNEIRETYGLEKQEEKK